MKGDLDLRKEVAVYLRSCFRRRVTPNVNELAARLHMSRFALRRRFRAQYGISLTRCFAEVRVRYAKRLLRRTGLSIRVIARRAAFADVRNFNRVFLRVTGETPSSYRKQVRRRKTRAARAIGRLRRPAAE